MVSPSKPTFSFPRIRRVVLRDFSLFTRLQEISLELEEGVFCLAGANGLGKSTFIAALNFGITGRVPDPKRPFESVEEYFRHTKDFSERFFDGRISELQRGSAEVDIEFSVADTIYRITRGMFEPDELRSLEIIDGSGTEDHAVVDASGLSGSEMQDRFLEHLTDKIGLRSFDQFVFLQLFLLTFDERRHLALWDARVLEQILFLAFGVDPDKARLADRLRRTAEKAASTARNSQWQATQIRNTLDDLENYLEDATEPTEELKTQYKDLVDLRSERQERADQIESELKDSRLRFDELSSEYAALRHDYEEAFASRASRQHGLQFHPIVVDSLKDERCALCGTKGAEAVGCLRDRVDGPDCPLCGSTLPSPEESDSGLDALRSIDDKMTDARKRTAIVTQTIDRLKQDLRCAVKELDEADRAVAGFERENEAFARERAAESSGVEDIAKAYRLQVEKLLERKEKALARRDEATTELRNLQRSVNEKYKAVETNFVPLFNDLARAFLGLDLDVRFEARSGKIGLVLELQNKERRLQHQLSESQRFFLDIALRMALAQLMSSGQDRATMLIDTPEGSLDSAYESRAGEMFARFVRDGYHIVMTANINTSQLLLRLAERCGRTKMKLSRMTEWTDLSEVQIQEEALFERAFSAIEESLERGSA